GGRAGASLDRREGNRRRGRAADDRRRVRAPAREGHAAADRPDRDLRHGRGLHGQHPPRRPRPRHALQHLHAHGPAADPDRDARRRRTARGHAARRRRRAVLRRGRRRQRAARVLAHAGRAPGRGARLPEALSRAAEGAMSPGALRDCPRLLTIEGGDGAGKSTVLEALRDELAGRGFAVVCTREPSGTPLAELIRGVLLDPSHYPPSPQAELLLMFASRAQHVRETVLPALERGAWVVSDRFTDSSYAYQGGGRGLDPEFIAELERRVVGIRPGLTLLLDVPVAEGRARANGRERASDRIERERDEFFERARAVFLARAEAEPARFRVIDARRDAATVAAEARALLRDHLAR